MDLDSLRPPVSLDDEPLSRKEYCRTWRHPFHRSIEVPYSTALVMAMIQMGVSDYAVIAKAAGLHVAEVRRIDMVEDRAVRQLGLAGIPHGVYFKLHEKVRCPKCNALVRMAPCIACNTMADAPLAECIEPDGDLPAGEHSHR
jgi:hypothetical protein